MAYFLKKSHSQKWLVSFRSISLSAIPKSKRPATAVIRSLGYVHEDCRHDIPESIEYYQLEVNRMNADFQSEKTSSKDKKNLFLFLLCVPLGYFPLKSVLDSLNLRVRRSFPARLQTGISLSKAFEDLSMPEQSRSLL